MNINFIINIYLKQVYNKFIINKESRIHYKMPNSFNNNVKNSPFGNRSFRATSGQSDGRWGSPHNGIDIVVDGNNRSVYSTTDGTVVGICNLNDRNGNDFGCYVAVMDKDGVIRRYQHLNDFASGLKVGDTVKAGQLIGEMGNKGGGSQGAHLHYEVFYATDVNGNFINDPNTLINNSSTNSGLSHYDNYLDAAKDLGIGSFNNQPYGSYSGLGDNRSTEETNGKAQKSGLRQWRNGAGSGTGTFNGEDFNPDTQSYTDIKNNGADGQKKFPVEEYRKDSDEYKTYSGSFGEPINENGDAIEYYESDRIPENHFGQVNIDNSKDSAATVSGSQIFEPDKYATSFEKYNNIYGLEKEFFETGFSYIFMTKPDINLEGSDDSFAKYLCNNFPIIKDSLNYSRDSSNKVPVFIPLITNSYASIGGIDDVSANQIEMNETYRGFKLILPAGDSGSYSAGTLNINFREQNPPLITYLHKAWYDYCKGVRRGDINPLLDAQTNRVVDYASSLYYFVTDPDGETLRFWAKYTGIIPISIPYSIFSSNPGQHDVPQASITYIYSYRELFNLDIITDFNDTMSNSARIYYFNANETDRQFTASSMSSNNSDILSDTSARTALESNGINDYYFNRIFITRDGYNFKLIMN